VARYPRYCWTCAALRNRCRISPFPGLVTPIVEIRRLVPGLCSALLWLTLEWSVLPGFRHSSDPSHITDAACSRPSCEADDGSLGGSAEAGSPRNWLARRQRTSSHGSGAPFYATSQPQASPSRPSLATPSAVVPVRPTNFDPSPALFSLMPNSPAPQGAPKSPLPQRYFAVEIAAQLPLGPAIRYGSTPRRHSVTSAGGRHEAHLLYLMAPGAVRWRRCAGPGGRCAAKPRPPLRRRLSVATNSIRRGTDTGRRRTSSAAALGAPGKQQSSACRRPGGCSRLEPSAATPSLHRLLGALAPPRSSALLCTYKFESSFWIFCSLMSYSSAP